MFLKMGILLVGSKNEYMKKNILKKFIAVLILVFLLGINFVFAEGEISTVDIHLKIVAGEDSLIDKVIAVLPCNSDNNTETVDTLTAYCAVMQSGLSSDWDWSWAPGAFVTTIGDVSGFTSKDKDNNDVYHYWSWSLNGSEAMIGLNQYDLNPNDLISLNFIDPVEQIEKEVTLPANTGDNNHRGGSSGSSVVTQKSFSIPNAISFIFSSQKSDGSYGFPLYTDWVAIGIASFDFNNEIFKTKISDYLKNDKFDSDIITNIERRSMALMSLGINPYSGTNINYIKKITDSFDSVQIGDISLINDDIFALIILNKVGYTTSDVIISKDISYIISNQDFDGSWGSVDMTAAAIVALSNFKNEINVNESITKGELYLKNKQLSDGSFLNTSSTSWAIQALSLNTSYNLEVERAIQYLAHKQNDDGGLDSDSEKNSRIWSTSYAIPAVLGLSWNFILKSFPKEEIAIGVVSKEKEVETIKMIGVETKKINYIKKEVEIKILTEEKLDNILSAISDVDLDTKTKSNTVISKIFKTLRKIKTPLSWLWLHLGF